MGELDQSESPREDRPGELQGLLAQRDEALAQARTRLAELEQTLAARDGEIVRLKQTAVEGEGRLSEATASYKTLVIQTSPGVVAELIAGDSISAINESLEKAKALVGRVRQGFEAEMAQARVPAGAPERTAPDLSGLSPLEKIQYVLGGKR